MYNYLLLASIKIISYIQFHKKNKFPSKKEQIFMPNFTITMIILILHGKEQVYH